MRHHGRLRCRHLLIELLVLLIELLILLVLFCKHLLKKAPFRKLLLDPLPETLKLRDAPRKEILLLIGLADHVFQPIHMAANPLDNRIPRPLQFLLEPLRGVLHILLIQYRLLALPALIAHEEHQDGTGNNKESHDFNNHKEENS